MSQFRAFAMLAVTVLLLAPPLSHDAQAQENAAAAAALEAAKGAVDAAPATSGEIAELDRQLAEFGWAGAAATTYAYAETCDADQARLGAFRQTQRK